MIKNSIILALITMNLVFAYALFKALESEQAQEPSPSLSNGESSAPDAASIIKSTENLVSIDGDQHLAANKEPQNGINLSSIGVDTDYFALAQQLRDAGYEEGILRQIILASINRDALLSQSNVSTNQYWRAEEGNKLEALSEKLNSETERRDQMVQIFGTEIVDDPIFADIFKPLNDTLPFLSSDKQIGLDQLIRKDELKTQSLFQGGFTSESRSDLAQQREQLQRQITELLGPDDALEYQLRESRLASNMRRGLSNFDYSENEFRDIFNLRSQNEGADLSSRFIDRSAFREQRDASAAQIRDYLGDARYEEYARSQDPSYRSLQSIGERYGNSTAEINDIYTLARETQEQVDELRNRNTLDREERQSRVNELRLEAFEKIEAIAGKETADSVRENSRRLGFGRRIPQ